MKFYLLIFSVIPMVSFGSFGSNLDEYINDTPYVEIEGVKYRLVHEQKLSDGQRKFYGSGRGYCRKQTGSPRNNSTFELASDSGTTGPFVALNGMGDVKFTFQDTEENSRKFVIVTSIQCLD